MLGGAAAAWPLAAPAQQAGKVPTIGFLGQSTRSAGSEWIAAFVQRLRELGWSEGRTIAIEYRWGEGRELLGLDQVIAAITGDAPIPVEILEFFRALGVPLAEIYGMSESSGPMTF